MQIYTLQINRRVHMIHTSVSRAVTLLLAMMLIAGPEARSQSRSLMELYGSGDDASTFGVENQKADQARKQAEQRYASALYAPLEGAVDRESYIVGPNDQFTVSIGGLEPIVSVVLVSADGGMVIPGVGRIEAGGRSLAEVQSSVNELLGSSFKNVQIDVALSRPREFWVHVTGAVPQPGRYLSLPVGRLEDALKQAFMLAESTNLDLAADFRPSLRNVSITRRDGSRTSYDLVRYYRTGDIGSNPYLQDGDAIHVPSYDRVRASIFVSGDIPFSGNYDFRSGDTILDVLALGTGDMTLHDDRTVRLTRRGEDGAAVSEDYTLGALTSGTIPPPVVRPLDHVNVPPPATRVGVAAADGWVHFPGQYPIEIGATTLVDLVEMAGGFREEALVRAAYLERDAALSKDGGLADLRPPSSARFEILTDSSSALWQMRLGDFDFFSRQFLARWLRMDRRVSVDVVAATRPGADPVYLQDGDRLFVPQDEQSVYVVGEVTRPGRTPVVSGFKTEDYIGAVGGRGPRASKTYVIRAGSGQILPASAEVFSGDYLFVNRKGGEASSIETERLRIMEEESNARNRQVWFQALTATAAVVTTTILVIQQFN
jgi:protein involved in polysaccharide export with SLBB domain